MRVVSIALRVLLLGAVTAPLVTAAAQDECMTTFSHAEWVQEMDGIDKSFATFDLDNARMQVDATWRHVGCLGEPVQPGHLARFARQRAQLAFFDQDGDNAIKWGLLARYSAPDFPWSVPEGHPFRTMIEEAEDPEIGGPDGSLLVPKGGVVLMNGWPITEPRARAEIPALVQVVDKKGVLLSTWWQDGAAFPPDLIGPAGVVVPPPECWNPPTSEDYAIAGGDQSQASAKPPITLDLPACGEEGPKGGGGGGGGGVAIVNLAAGGGLALLSGGAYAIAAVNAGKMDDANNERELVKARSSANAMVFTSAGLGAAAIGVGTTAFFMNGAPTFGVNVRW